MYTYYTRVVEKQVTDATGEATELPVVTQGECNQYCIVLCALQSFLVTKALDFV